MLNEANEQVYSYKLIPSTSSKNNSITKSEFVLSCNFDRLATQYPELNSARTKNLPPQSAFDPSTKFNKTLTRCLLRHHFNLQLPSLPQGRLCPPIPNRANYVRWMRELILSSSNDLEEFSTSSFECPSKDSKKYDNNLTHDTQRSTLQFQGIDVGTGVSAIYPLLLSTELFAKSGRFRELCDGSNAQGANSCKTVEDTDSQCSQQPQHKIDGRWKFLATDIDPIAVDSALINVKANNLEDQICVVQVKKASEYSRPTSSNRSITKLSRGPLFSAMLEARHNTMFQTNAIGENEKDDLSIFPKFDFVMTNPPFYGTTKEATAPRAGDKRSRTEMTSNEAVYIQSHNQLFDHDCNTKNQLNEGGDIGFILDIMKDSEFFRHHVTWYTSLVAKRSSLDAILHRLQTLNGVWGNRGQIRTVEFRQGSSSNLGQKRNANDDPLHCSPRVRWGIAWTYERAASRCTSCMVTSGLISFNVSLSGQDILSDKKGKEKDNAYCEEIVSRLKVYFSSFRESPLKCTSQIRNGLHCVTVIEERFAQTPSSASCNDDIDNDNLPYDGHFVIDAIVRVTNNSPQDQSGQHDARIEVNLEIYCHTKYGNILVDKIRGPLPGEIGRTNRRWRRRKQKFEPA